MAGLADKHPLGLRISIIRHGEAMLGVNAVGSQKKVIYAEALDKIRGQQAIEAANILVELPGHHDEPDSLGSTQDLGCIQGIGRHGDVLLAPQCLGNALSRGTAVDKNRIAFTDHGSTPFSYALFFQGQLCLTELQAVDDSRAVIQGSSPAD